MRWTTFGLDARGGAIVGIFRTRSTQSLGAAVASLPSRTERCAAVEDEEEGAPAGAGPPLHLGSETDDDSRSAVRAACRLLLPAPPALLLGIGMAPPPVVGCQFWLAMTARESGRTERRGGGDMEPDLGRSLASLTAWGGRNDKSRDGGQQGSKDTEGHGCVVLREKRTVLGEVPRIP